MKVVVVTCNEEVLQCSSPLFADSPLLLSSCSSLLSFPSSLLSFTASFRPPSLRVYPFISSAGDELPHSMRLSCFTAAAPAAHSVRSKQLLH